VNSCWHHIKDAFVFACNLCSDEIQYIKLPRDIDDAKNLGEVLSRYTDRYFYEVVGGYLVTYILYPFVFVALRVKISTQT